ncbi:hypothetical protein Angca_009340, partial [Angiostrongylus cantonensis]
PIPLYWAYALNTRILILAYGIISTVGTVFYPLADRIGLWPSLVARFLSVNFQFHGFAQAAQLHFTNEVVLTWAMQTEASLFFSILLAASQIGPLFTMVLGGEMCSSPLGWEATYYTLGFLTLVTTLTYSLVYSDNVEKNRLYDVRFDNTCIHRFVSEEEAKKIIEGRKAVIEKAPVPYLDLLSDLSIWTNFILFVGYYVGMIIYQQYSPTFIKQVLNYSIRETGYFSAIPMVFAIILKVAIGKLIDHGLCFGPKWRLAGPLVFLEFFSALSIFLTGFIGAQHAHFALNFNMFIAGFVQILLPGGVQLMVPENTKEQWSILFYCITAIIISTTILYVVCVKVEAAHWTKPKAKTTSLELGRLAAFSRISYKCHF